MTVSVILISPRAFLNPQFITELEKGIIHSQEKLKAEINNTKLIEWTPDPLIKTYIFKVTPLLDGEVIDNTLSSYYRHGLNHLKERFKTSVGNNGTFIEDPFNLLFYQNGEILNPADIILKEMASIQQQYPNEDIEFTIYGSTTEEFGIIESVPKNVTLKIIDSHTGELKELQKVNEENEISQRTKDNLLKTSYRVEKIAKILSYNKNNKIFEATTTLLSNLIDNTKLNNNGIESVVNVVDKALDLFNKTSSSHSSAKFFSSNDELSQRSIADLSEILRRLNELCLTPNEENKTAVLDSIALLVKNTPENHHKTSSSSYVLGIIGIIGAIAIMSVILSPLIVINSPFIIAIGCALAAGSMTFGVSKVSDGAAQKDNTHKEEAYKGTFATLAQEAVDNVNISVDSQPEYSPDIQMAPK
ncbi:MAG TPA: hypothetical protein PK657_13530 [Legionella sp.]|nr:hypothetical protein [Legionella sp.]